MAWRATNGALPRVGEPGASTLNPRSADGRIERRTGLPEAPPDASGTRSVSRRVRASSADARMLLELIDHEAGTHAGVGHGEGPVRGPR